MTPRKPRTGRRQRGAALLVAMLVMTLVATLASAMVWQQWRAVQVEAAERARAQAAWILAGALDWARLILREDARNGGADHLGEPWAVPLAEARLSSFLAADRESGVVADDGPEAFLSGSITDAQARYNLSNLVVNGQPQAAEIASLQRLFGHIGVSPSIALTIAGALRDAAPAAAAASAASSPGGATPQTMPTLPASVTPPLQPRTLSQVTWLGVDADTLRRMRPYVTLLPTTAPTKVNVNTAPREVIAAVVENLDIAAAERLVQQRERSPFREVADVQSLLGAATPLDLSRLDTRTSHFEVRGRLRLGDRVLEESSIVRRGGAGNLEITTLTRDRVNSQDALP